MRVRLTRLLGNLRSANHCWFWDLFTGKKTWSKHVKKYKQRKAYLEVEGPATSPDLEGDDTAAGLIGGGMTARQKGWSSASPTLESPSEV